MNEQLESILKYVTENNRICPMPQRWNELYQLLPGKKQVGVGWEPPLPLILAAWHDTPGLLKILRLRQHIEWAAEKGALENVDVFLRALPEEGWYHGHE